ncbi:MAG: DUF3291 domain-containing protein [Mangrovicoccus sp.]
MMQPNGYHLAELNFGILRHDWDDPRVAEFVEALDAVNAVAERSPGFVWRLSDEEMDAAQNDPDGALGGNPRMASTLSVWEDPQSLKHFVFNTVHARFYKRGAEWFAPETGGNLVMWWVAKGHRPSIEDGKARHAYWAAHGDTDQAFGWSTLTEAGSGHQSCALNNAEVAHV